MGTVDQWEHRRKIIELLGTVGSLFGVAAAIYPPPELFSFFPTRPWIAFYFIIFIVLILDTYSRALAENEITYEKDASLLSVIFSFALSIYVTETMLQPLSETVSRGVMALAFVGISFLILVALNFQFRRVLRASG